MSITKPSMYNIEIKLGEEEIKLRKWKAKDLSTFQSVLENSHDIENLETDQLFQLVTPCIENYSGKHYSHYDLLYMMFVIRKETLGNEIGFEYLCESCHQPMGITVKLDETSKYEPDTFSSITVGNLVFHVEKDIKESVLATKQNDENYEEYNQSLIELLLRVSSFEEDGVVHNTYTFDELHEFIDNMDLIPYTQLLTTFIDQMSYFECSGEYTCENCGNIHIFEFDILPSFFGTL